MTGIARFTLIALIAAVLAVPASAGAAAPESQAAEAGRPLASRLLDRLLAPLLGWFAESHQDGGSQRDPDGLAAVEASAENDPDGGGQSDPDGYAVPPPPAAPAENEQDGGSQSDPNG